MIFYFQGEKGQQGEIGLPVSNVMMKVEFCEIYQNLSFITTATKVLRASLWCGQQLIVQFYYVTTAFQT